MRTIKTITKMSRVRRSIVWSALMFVAAGGSLLASGALASPTAKPKVALHRQAIHRRSRLAVFSHPLSRKARLASAGDLQAPAGAMLAAASSDREIYAWQPTAAQESSPMQNADGGNSTCMVKLLTGGPESIACGSTTEIEDRGLIGINMPSKLAPNLSATALVPNGVASVTVTDDDGASYAVPVSHNAVIVEDPNLAAVSFDLPNGGVNIAKVSEAAAK